VREKIRLGSPRSATLSEPPRVPRIGRDLRANVLDLTRTRFERYRDCSSLRSGIRLALFTAHMRWNSAPKSRFFHIHHIACGKVVYVGEGGFGDRVQLERRARLGLWRLLGSGLGLFVASVQAFELLSQTRNFVLKNVHNDVEVDAHVIVNKSISQRDDSPPRNRIVSCTEIGIDF
jgi:hypothetical protein